MVLPDMAKKYSSNTRRVCGLRLAADLCIERKGGILLESSCHEKCRTKVDIFQIVEMEPGGSALDMI